MGKLIDVETVKYVRGAPRAETIALVRKGLTLAESPIMMMESPPPGVGVSRRLIRPIVTLAALLALWTTAPAQEVPPDEILLSMKKAASYFRTEVAAHGGYVYYYSLDLSRRWGEGKATQDQIWVQPPGTPRVGAAYLAAFEVTRDPFYLEAAKETAAALLHGQLESGGWTHAIDFAKGGKRVAHYREGRGSGRNYSSLDDGITQGALRFLMAADGALGFKDARIHEAVEYAATALFAAQFPSGGFPQVWTGSVPAHPPVKANYPDYDWKTENRIKEYWDMPTLNDGLAGSVAETLLTGWEIYQDRRYLESLKKLGDFLILAQMPEPQPGWAQQYDASMRPIWARKFEPPAIAGRESEDAIATLLLIHRVTKDPKYLEPIPRALAYLKRSLLPNGQLARFYELKSNRPLYMTREYELTYSDEDVPRHYGWKTDSRLEKLERNLGAASAAQSPRRPKKAATIRAILGAMDPQGRWVSTYTGQPLTGQPKFKEGEQFLSSEVFSTNLEALAGYAAGKE